MQVTVAKNSKLLRKSCEGTKVDEDLIIFDPDTGYYYNIRGVGLAIWNMLSQPTSIDEICSALLKEYSIDPKSCRREVNSFADALIECELAKVVE